ncbi:MAG TPA: DMT family transporter, partial [Candidatus Saccharimonadales bacterium]|nr:DMT family transporter [Candidatus Saccharimonadales bacterium]
MKSTDSDRKKGIIALIILAFVFATMGIFVRFLQTDFTILQQTYLRIFAAFVLGLILFRKDLNFSKLRKISKKEWGILVLRSVSLYLIGVTLLSQAYVSAKYTNVSFVGALPMTAILGFIVLREKVTVQKIAFVLLGFIGVAFIAVKDYSQVFIWGHG